MAGWPSGPLVVLLAISPEIWLPGLAPSRLWGKVGVGACTLSGQSVMHIPRFALNSDIRCVFNLNNLRSHHDWQTRCIYRASDGATKPIKIEICWRVRRKTYFGRNKRIRWVFVRNPRFGSDDGRAIGARPSQDWSRYCNWLSPGHSPFSKLLLCQ